MRALAIFGPTATENDLVPFRAAGGEIRATEDLQQAGEAVLVLGGDGTVQRQLAQLIQMRVPLLVVPTGSANDFARALGLRTQADALRAWKEFLNRGGNVRAIDVGVIEFVGESRRATRPPVYFCCAVGAGVDAVVARQANSLPGWLRAHGGYFLAAIPALVRFQARHITVTVCDQDGGPAPRLSEAGILAAAANAPWYGHGMHIAPQAKLDDGQLEVCFVRGMGKLRLLRLFPKVYRGTHVGLAEVEYFRAPRLRIESDRPLEVHADGEPVGRTPVEVSVLPGALRVIVQQEWALQRIAEN